MKKCCCTNDGSGCCSCSYDVMEQISAVKITLPSPTGFVGSMTKTNRFDGWRASDGDIGCPDVVDVSNDPILLEIFNTLAGDWVLPRMHPDDVPVEERTAPWPPPNSTIENGRWAGYFKCRWRLDFGETGPRSVVTIPEGSTTVAPSTGCSHRTYGIDTNVSDVDANSPCGSYDISNQQVNPGPSEPGCTYSTGSARVEYEQRHYKMDFDVDTEPWGGLFHRLLSIDYFALSGDDYVPPAGYSVAGIGDGSWKCYARFTFRDEEDFVDEPCRTSRISTDGQGWTFDLQFEHRCPSSESDQLELIAAQLPDFEARFDLGGTPGWPVGSATDPYAKGSSVLCIPCEDPPCLCVDPCPCSTPGVCLDSNRTLCLEESLTWRRYDPAGDTDYKLRVGWNHAAISNGARASVNITSGGASIVGGNPVGVDPDDYPELCSQADFTALRDDVRTLNPYSYTEGVASLACDDVESCFGSPVRACCLPVNRELNAEISLMSNCVPQYPSSACDAAWAAFSAASETTPEGEPFVVIGGRLPSADSLQSVGVYGMSKATARELTTGTGVVDWEYVGYVDLTSYKNGAKLSYIWTPI